MGDQCTQVTPQCPVSATTLGYYPNKPLNIFIAVAFGIAAVITLVFGVWKKTWAYMGFILAGCALEMAGYAGRVALSSNPYNEAAFETQICAIVLAPTLVCISLYLTLKHLFSALNPSLSRVRPKWLPFIFVPFDVSCLFIQAIGGGIAAAGGSTNQALLDAGNHAIIAGIALQVVVLLLFGAMAADYYLRARRWVRSGEATAEALALWRDRKFRMFGGAVLGAYVCVQIRCIYRVAEMAGGWGNPIMQDQPSFTVLDSFMMLINVYLLACFPPGILVPSIGKTGDSSKQKEEHDVEHSAGRSDEESKEPPARLQS